MSNIAELCSLVDDLTTVVIEVTRREMRAAARALAAAVRQQEPAATAIRLVDSDQGDWLDAQEWLSQDTGEWEPIELGLLDDAGYLASHLYLPHLDAVPGLSVVDGRAGRGAHYTLTLEEVLNATEEAALVDLLVVRDPDGPTTVTVALAGVLADPLGLRETHVDAGAGWEWEGWTEYRDTAVANVRPPLRDHLLAAFGNPPGGRYIEGRDEQPWLPEGL